MTGHCLCPPHCHQSSLLSFRKMILSLTLTEIFIRIPNTNLWSYFHLQYTPSPTGKTIIFFLQSQCPAEDRGKQTNKRRQTETFRKTSPSYLTRFLYTNPESTPWKVVWGRDLTFLPYRHLEVYLKPFSSPYHSWVSYISFYFLVKKYQIDFKPPYPSLRISQLESLWCDKVTEV